MADILISVVEFKDIPAFGEAELPHGINIDEVAELPDWVFVDQPGFEVEADALNVRVKNTQSFTASVDVLCQRWHSIARVISPVEGLTSDINDRRKSLITRPFYPVAPGKQANDRGNSLADLAIQVAANTSAIYNMQAQINALQNGQKCLDQKFASLCKLVQENRALIQGMQAEKH